MIFSFAILDKFHLCLNQQLTYVGLPWEPAPAAAGTAPSLGRGKPKRRSRIRYPGAWTEVIPCAPADTRGQPAAPPGPPRPSEHRDAAGRGSSAADRDGPGRAAAPAAPDNSSEPARSCRRRWRMPLLGRGVPDASKTKTWEDEGSRPVMRRGDLGSRSRRGGPAGTGQLPAPFSHDALASRCRLPPPLTKRTIQSGK